jgi:hypothetical protein
VKITGYLIPTIILFIKVNLDLAYLGHFIDSGKLGKIADKEFMGFLEYLLRN